MKLTKYKLGELIVIVNEKNKDRIYPKELIRGISTNKYFMETKADTNNVDESKYKIVYPRHFAYVADTSRRGNKISLSFNFNREVVLVSSISTIFKVGEVNSLIPEYLYIYFNRPEFDRYSRFNSWGSAREVFSWDDMCDIDIELPSIEIQQKYVDIYKGMLENQKSYETGLEDLKLTCDAYMDRLKYSYDDESIGQFIREVNEKNEKLEVNNPQGIDINDGFIEPKRIAKAEKNAKIVRKGQFAYNKVIKSNGTRIPIGYREKEDCTVSSSYQVFKVVNKQQLNDRYLILWLLRLETQRCAGFNAWGSTRDNLNFFELCEIKIPLAPIEIQQSIADIYSAYKERKAINEILKKQIKDICKILIKGSIEEARKG